MDTYKKWINRKFLDWQSDLGRRASIREFSEYIGFSQSVVTNWMNGIRKPGADSADQICIALGYDLTIYDVLELPRPEKRLLEFKAMYPTMTDDDRADLDRFLEKVRRRHAAEEKRHVSKSGSGDPDRSPLNAG